MLSLTQAVLKILEKVKLYTKMEGSQELLEAPCLLLGEGTEGWPLYAKHGDSGLYI